MDRIETSSLISYTCGLVISNKGAKPTDVIGDRLLNNGIRKPMCANAKE